MSELEIASIVATGKFNREFDLEAIANDLKYYSCDYSIEKHPGLFIKFYEDGPTVTIYRSGSCNIRGAHSMDELYKNKSLLEGNMTNIGIENEITGFHITNIVFTIDIGERLNLSELTIKLGLENVEYEPEQFPGLIYRIDQGVILVFSTGKLVLTGFTNTEDAKNALHKLSAKLTDV